MHFSLHSETERLRELILKRPEDAFRSRERIDAQWETLHYTSPPDYPAAIREYDAFVDSITSFVEKIRYLPFDESVGLDSIYVRDSMVMTDRGAVLCNMGKEARRPEPGAVRRFLESEHIPILGQIEGEGLLEGGDVVFLGSGTLAVGQGYRSNGEGLRQLRKLTGEFINKIVPVPLPHWNGPDDVLHLMSILSPIDDRLALVHSPLMSVPFRQRMKRMGIRLIEVPAEEFTTMGCNVLTLKPGLVLMLAGNPCTRQKLESAGIEVLTYTGEHISTKGAGGPTCLTRPLHRSQTPG